MDIFMFLLFLYKTQNGNISSARRVNELIILEQKIRMCLISHPDFSVFDFNYFAGTPRTCQAWKLIMLKRLTANIKTAIINKRMHYAGAFPNRNPCERGKRTAAI